VAGGPTWLHPEAIAEARAARQWYESRSVAAGAAFMAELDVAIERIEETPGAWPRYLAATRRYLLRRFPFFLVFRESRDGVQIVPVAHASRKPGYWIGR
jgi:plasmid stabilization system protein ParE